MKIQMIVLLTVFGCNVPLLGQEVSLFRLPKAERSIMLIKTDSGVGPATPPRRRSPNVDVVLARSLNISNGTQTVEVSLIDIVICTTGVRNESNDDVKDHGVVSADVVNLSFPISAKIAIDGQLVPVQKAKEYISAHWLIDTPKPSSVPTPGGVQESAKENANNPERKP